MPSAQLEAKKAEAATLPRVLLSDIDINWLQTIGEGWAAPLRGFMREGALVQALHHNSLLVDPYNVTGHKGALEALTEWNGYTTRQRASMSIPIVLPITDYTKYGVEHSGKAAVALTTKDGQILAILRNPEVYKNRKEEIVARTWGVIDPGHPYIKHIYSGGDWLLGGEVELLGRVRYNDGLDQYRLTAKELVDEFVRRGADAVFAFQTRNPTHAGHAYLMKTAREKLLAKGYKNPVLWLSPLGGWTKADDVPLDVRVKQHVAVLNEGASLRLSAYHFCRQWPQIQILTHAFSLHTQKPIRHAGPQDNGDGHLAGPHDLRGPHRGDLPRQVAAQRRRGLLCRGARPRGHEGLGGGGHLQGRRPVPPGPRPVRLCCVALCFAVLCWSA